MHCSGVHSFHDGKRAKPTKMMAKWRSPLLTMAKSQISRLTTGAVSAPRKDLLYQEQSRNRTIFSQVTANVAVKRKLKLHLHIPSNTRSIPSVGRFSFVKPKQSSKS